MNRFVLRSFVLRANRPRQRLPRRGTALVLTLAIVVLMSGLIVAFFSRALLNKQISTAYVAHSRTDSIADTALNVIVGDLRSEIAAGSTANVDSSGAGVTIYQPLTAANVRPEASGSLTREANLIKRSASGTGFWTGGPVRAAASNTQNDSRNRAGITPSRWNAPYLLTGPPAATPDWCLVLRSGVLDGAPPSIGTLSDNAPSNDDYAIGRFAYMIYDVGGLLDINVAGNNLTVADNVRRGRLHAADLSAIPGIADPAALVAWRNPTANTTWLQDPANTFRNIRADMQPQEKSFVRRQDLIRFAQSAHGSTILGTNALRYLTTFTRQRNAPSWLPETPSGSTIDYAADANTPSSANRFLPNVRVQTAFTRPDGTTANVGEPLLKQRFPLGRLAWVRDDATAAAGSDIDTYFGLTRPKDGDTPWVYRKGATSILTLNEVAQAGREPDYFELLKAAILSGALGTNGGAQSAILERPLSQNKDMQILQIGANIIDQYDTDDAPTAIEFPIGSETYTLYGIENLPYIDVVYTPAFRTNRDAAPNDTYTYPHVEGWYQFSLWNPHQNASAAGSKNFRIVGTKGESWLWQSPLTKAQVEIEYIGDGRYLEFTASGSDFGEPRLLVPNSSMAPGVSLTGVPVTSYSPPANYYGFAEQPSGASLDTSGGYPVSTITNTTECYLVGIYAGKAEKDEHAITNKVLNETKSGNTAQYHVQREIDDEGYGPTFDLQYRDGSGSWRTYQTLRNVNLWLNLDQRPGYLSCNTFAKSGGSAFGWGSGRSMDPRTKRGGLAQQNNWPWANRTAWSNQHWGQAWQLNVAGHSNYAPQGPLWHYHNGNTFRPGHLQDNARSPTYVQDQDHVRRRSEGDVPNGVLPMRESLTANFDQSNCVGNPHSGAIAARPIMLNRPFQSVAEMGYAMRDEPWKSINFYSNDSADAALLDVFSLDEAAQVAGRINLNTAHPEVLQAMLQGAVKADNGTASPSTLSSLEAQAAAQAIVNATHADSTNPAKLTHPLVNVSELATRLGDSFASALGATTAGVKQGYIKTQRESIVRALAGVSDTRTWNLMIDVIAQTGRYPSGSASLDDFLVEGERRYWLHVALDRYTGDVIDWQLEPVYE